MASDKTLRVDSKVHELKLGASFDPKSNVAFHSIRYDFKPASVDTSQESLVEVGEGHQVTVTVPHVEGSGTTQTVYKGNKRECPKECVLIIDHNKGTFTLETLTNNIQLKKTRIEGRSKASLSGRPLTPVEHNKQQKMSPVKPKVTPSPQGPPPPTESPAITPTPVEEAKDVLIGEISESSDSDDNSDYDSSSNESDKEATKQATPSSVQTSNLTSSSANLNPSYGSFLKTDLQLSDSSSDSD